MSELIDRQMSLAEIDDTIAGSLNRSEDVYIDKGLMMARRLIEKMPSIEVVPVRHGRWIAKLPYEDEVVKDLEFQIVCSECDEQNASITFDENSVPIAKTFYRTKFCPNCGARMDANEIAERRAAADDYAEY